MKPLARAIAAWLVGGSLASGSFAGDALAEGFANPPDDARPLVFWQWVNGNVTQEGIRLDLEWMKRVGLAGAILFDIGFRTPPVPQYVAQRVGFGTPEWREAVRVAASEAKRLGLLLGAQSSGGWSVSGGPSVPPEQAMKKLVWSETLVTPRSSRELRLPPPPSVNGPFQDLLIPNADFRDPTRSADVAVIAFRLPEIEQRRPRNARLFGPEGKGIADAALLEDGSFMRSLTFMPDAKGEIVINARLGVAPSAVTLALRNGAALPSGVIETSQDGKEYLPVADLYSIGRQPSPVTSFALRHRNQRHWRITLHEVTKPVEITELRFETGAFVERWQGKAAFGVENLEAHVIHPAEQARTVDPRQVIDVTSRMTPDGALSWRPTEGKWQVLRFGWSLTGRRSVPATSESIGLEVDKFDAGAVRAFAESFYSNYQRAIGDAGALDIAFTDSWEAGQQNWTQDMLGEFQRRRGYDLRPWMPVLTGRVVGSTEESERLLADFRRTLSDLVVEHHYGVLADAAHRHGMRYVAQAPGVEDPMPVDAFAAKSRVDVPTAEFWVWPENAQPDLRHLGDVRDAASVARIQGSKLVAAESLTTQGENPFAQGPAQWRRMMDRFFAEGVNKVILHTSAHQPFTDRRPGITLRQYGQHFTRNETWAEHAGAWVDYLARTSFLLQQGRAVSDLLIFEGEDPPLFHSWNVPWSGLPQLARPGPRESDADFIHADALMQLEVRDGRLVLPSGASYLALEMSPMVKSASLPVLRKLHQLADQGAVLIRFGNLRPLGISDPAQRVATMSSELVPGGPEHPPLRRGLGRLYFNWDHARITEGWTPDVEFDEKLALAWTHRRTDSTDIYFLSNQSAGRIDDRLLFRVKNRHAELWDAVTGRRLGAQYSPAGERTSVKVSLEPWSSIFVVFRGEARSSAVTSPTRLPLLVLNEGWEVQFFDEGAPRESIRLAAGSWTRQDSPQVRYYSGRARYSRKIQVPASRLAGGLRIELDLGGVGDLAHVRVNGRDLGTWWSAPFRGDITDALRPGNNDLEITVSNYWANRLIGDEQRGAQQLTFSSLRPYRADSPLRPAGLLGPVQLISLIPGKAP